MPQVSRTRVQGHQCGRLLVYKKFILLFFVLKSLVYYIIAYKESAVAVGKHGKY